MDVFFFLELVRRNKPLVHHITNWVTIYDCAQVVKSLGASPVMAHAPEEAADMAGIASALVLNIGTLTVDIIESMKIAGRAANGRGIPIVLDVCGAGATSFRDEKCFDLLDNICISIVKGNASEIARVAGRNVRTKGVDATEVGADLTDIAVSLAKKKNCTVVITGKEDIVTDSASLFTVRNGDEMMSHVVGTGCMATSVIGTFAGASPGALASAAAAGLSCYEIAAEVAVKKSGGPASFKYHLLDSLFHLTRDDVMNLQRVAP
jgi:hydroxyethylthiazole kinase